LKPGDIVIKVAQEAQTVDVVGMRLDDVVKKIKVLRVRSSFNSEKVMVR
jgi:hypothetical protein